MRSNNNGFICFVTIFLFVVCSAAVYDFGTAESATITVANTWTKSKTTSGEYFVSTDDGRVFEITDSFLRLQFRSSDIYAKMLANNGKKFNIEYYGIRIGPLSFYPSIYNATLADQ